MSSKSVQKEYQEKVSRKNVKIECLAKSVKKDCLDDWGGVGAALVDDSASHLRK